MRFGSSVSAVVASNYCERLSDQIYLDLIGGRYSCFRLLNGTHEVGCSSSEKGNEGIVLYANSSDELISVIKNLDFQDGIITALNLSLLNEKTVEVLRDNRVRGILILYDNISIDNQKQWNGGFSEDASCPNEQFDLYGKCVKEWNKRGALLPEGFRFINWDKPIFVIENHTEIDIVKNSCYAAFNRDNLKGTVLCSARMKHFMRAAGNARLCLQRQNLFYGFADAVISLCDPLGDKNLFATIPAFAENFKPKILMLSVRMDSFSSFTEAAVGEVSVLTSLICLLAVTKTISNHLKEFEVWGHRNNRAVIIAFFHGESMGYIGSSATVDDIIRKKFPLNIKLTDIESFIEVQVKVQQLDGSYPLFSAYIDSESYSAFGNELKVKILLDAAKSALKHFNSKNSAGIKSEVLEEKTQIPPSSYHSFLKKHRGIPGFVLRPSGQQYVYNRINSLEDQNVFKEGFSEVKDQIVAAASCIVGAVAGFLTSGNESEMESISHYDIDEKYVTTLLDCFLQFPNWHTCRFFTLIMKGDDRFGNDSKETYIPAGANHYSLIRILMNALIVNVLGSKNLVNISDRGQCEDLNRHQKIYHYTWQFDPEENNFFCYRSSLHETDARSPAFSSEDYDMRSGVYSTWVESVWTPKQLKLFLTINPSPIRDIVIFTSGSVFFIVSLFIMELIYLGHKEIIESMSSTSSSRCIRVSI
ncbi:unnamed protein product [Thelazia callipaeda]|uniref:Nicastrin n=1 Tax=Thelazia callipaeda TaxID=103827 RepID=A0A0N5D831_THECL|nr:unnamed protein product [Thelazia callipaeda]